MPVYTPITGTEFAANWGIYGLSTMKLCLNANDEETGMMGRRGLIAGVEQAGCFLTTGVPHDVGFVKVTWWAKTYGTPAAGDTVRFGVATGLSGDVRRFWSPYILQTHAVGPVTFQQYTTYIDCTGAYELLGTGQFNFWLEGTCAAGGTDVYYLITYLEFEQLSTAPPPYDVFPFEANGGESVIERHGYLTDVLTSRNRTEQRVQLRELSVGGLEYSMLHLDPEEPQTARRMIYTGQDQQWALPLWPYGSRLTAAAVVPTNILQLDTVGLPFGGAGDLVVLWRSWEEHLLAEVLSVTASQINLLGLIGSGTWPAGTFVFPVRLARMAIRQDFAWPTIRYGDARVAFTFDIPTPAADPGTFTQYQGFDVLEVLGNRDQDIVYEIDRKAFVLDATTGKRETDASEVAPAESGTMRWFCADRDDAAELRGFLDARKGRAIPFWRPTWNADFVLNASASAAATSLVVKSWGYAAHVFPIGQARRHIAVRPAGGSPEYHEVTNAVDNLDGTETLTISPGLVAAAPASALVSFMLLSRLADDVADIDWAGGHFAECEMGITELPMETP